MTRALKVLTGFVIGLAFGTFLMFIGPFIIAIACYADEKWAWE